MKRIFFYLGVVLSLMGGVLLAQPSFAASNIEANVESAVYELRQIGKYSEHFATIFSPMLTSSVEYYKEYNYLHAVDRRAQDLLCEYNDARTAGTAPSADLIKRMNDVIEAVRDAKIVCNLKFGTNRKIAAVTPEPSPAPTNSAASASVQAAAPASRSAAPTASSNAPAPTLIAPKVSALPALTEAPIKVALATKPASVTLAVATSNATNENTSENEDESEAAVYGSAAEAGGAGAGAGAGVSIGLTVVADESTMVNQSTSPEVPATSAPAEVPSAGELIAYTGAASVVAGAFGSAYLRQRRTPAKPGRQ